MEEEIIIIESEEEQEIITIEEDIEYIEPTTQEKTIVPTEEQQIVVPDDGVFALSKVNVESIPSEYIKPTGTLDIVANGEYDVTDYAKANVDVGGGITKGLKINAFDENGCATDIEIVGMTIIPSYYLYSAGYNDGWLKKESNLKLPDNITSIEKNAFYRSNVTYVNQLKSLITLRNQAFRESNLNSIDLPATVVIIDTNVFYGCTNLNQFILRATTPPTLGSNAFKNSPIDYSTPTGYIYVPDESVDTYKSATNWSTYASAIKGLSELEG